MRRFVPILVLILFAGNTLAPSLPGNPLPAARAEAESQPAGATTALVDNYGYTAAPVSWVWVDIPNKTPVTFGEDKDDAYVSPMPDAPFLFPIGFDFPFYENTYSQLRVSTNGYLTLDTSVSEQLPRNLALPSDQKPNNIIAPFWDDLIKGSGTIYYANGVDYFAVQWSSVSRFNSSYPLTFQVLLFNNGNILFQYEEMSVGLETLSSASVGIEDGDGVDGISYLFNGVGVPVTSHSSTLISRPGAGRRAKLTPLYSGGFVVSGKASFEVSLTNTGNVQTGDLFDNYTLTSSIEAQSIPGWQVAYLLDGAPVSTSGVLAQSTSREFRVVVTPPLAATVGDHALIRLKATSTQDVLKSATVSVQVAVPAKFMHAYADAAGMHLGRYWKENIASTNFALFDENVAVAPAGENYVMVWDVQEGVAANLKYTIVNRLGIPDLFVHYLENDIQTNDRFPSLASGLGADPRIAVVWSRSRQEIPGDPTSDPIYNLMLAVLNPDSEYPLILPPTQVTDNSTPYNTLGGVQIEDAHAFWVDAEKLWIVWKEKHFLDLDSTSTDIRMGLFNVNTLEWAATPQFLASGTASIFYTDPTLIGLSDGTVLAFFSGESLEQKTKQISWAVLGPDGVLKGQTALGSLQGGSLDAAVLDDKLMFAWVSPDRGAVSYSLFSILGSGSDLSLSQMAAQSLVLTNLNLVEHISVFADQQDNGILTWKNVDDTQMYYALVNSAGELQTPAVMFFRDPLARIMVSKNGQSSTVYTGTYPLNLPLIRK